jgi:hypothetical protein
MSATEPGAKSSSFLDTGLVSAEASCFDFSIVVLGVLPGFDCEDVVCQKPHILYPILKEGDFGHRYP